MKLTDEFLKEAAVTFSDLVEAASSGDVLDDIKFLIDGIFDADSSFYKIISSDIESKREKLAMKSALKEMYSRER